MIIYYFMNPLREKLAALLTKSSVNGMKTLDPHSPCAMVLKKKDVDRLIYEDIKRICDEARIAEISRIIYLSALLKIVSREERRMHKEEIKNIANSVVERYEDKKGKLHLPNPCRDILLNL